MAAVPRFRHDVFVSYAHSDNLPVAGTEGGFVSQLVSDLRTEVGRKVNSNIDIWWDHYKLSGNTPVTPEIMAAAAECASIVVVASPAYLRSEWCDRERSVFCQRAAAGQLATPGAIFIVGLEPIAQEKLPTSLRDLTGYPFYRTLDDGRTTRPLRTEFQTDKEPYYNTLSRLVQNVSDHLERLIGATQSRTAENDDGKPSVLLLDVTDDLTQRRAELKAYLEQSGLVVLPSRRYSRDDMGKHREQMLADLERSRVCVQMLGPLTGDRSDDPRGIACLRADTIRASGSDVPFVQWRDPDLDLDAITDPDARDLIAQSSVRSDRFPDFRRSIAELALKPPKALAPRPPQNVLSVFVNSDLLDRDLGTGLAEWLAARGFMVLEPPHTTEDAREEWETNLRLCDSLMLVYGSTKPGWVRTQILLSNKVKRDNPLDVLAVCVGPPLPEPTRDKAADLALRYSGIHYVRVEDRQQLNHAELEKFAARLREAHGHL